MLNLIKQYTSAVTALIKPNEIRNQVGNKNKNDPTSKGKGS